MKPTLLIAGAGYLGQEILRQAERTWDTHALTRSGEDQTHPCDLSSAEEVQLLTQKIPQPQEIILCASSGRGGPAAYRAVFLQGAKNLHRAFPEARIHFTSSTSVYHQTDGSSVDEDSSTEPIRETSQILLEAEKAVLRYGGSVARLAGLYGPDRSVVFRKFMDGSATLEESGNRILNQIHVRDAATALLHLATLKCNRLFNVSDNRPLTQLQTYQVLSELTGKPLPPRGEKNLSRKRAWTSKAVSNARLRATGWHPAFPSFAEAVATFPDLKKEEEK